MKDFRKQTRVPLILLTIFFIGLLIALFGDNLFYWWNGYGFVYEHCEGLCPLVIDPVEQRAGLVMLLGYVIMTFSFALGFAYFIYALISKFARSNRKT